MAEAFGIACHELVSLDFRCGSQPEVSDGHENVGFRGQSGSRIRAAGCRFIAISRPFARLKPAAVDDRPYSGKPARTIKSLSHAFRVGS